ncbi:hypothetical protein CH373_17950, partial [Leptospira perolatii]
KKVNSTTKSVTHVSGLKCYLCSRFFTFLGGGRSGGELPFPAFAPTITNRFFNQPSFFYEILVGAPTFFSSFRCFKLKTQ